MPRILRAHGPSGNQGADWNWCEAEPVGVHGFVCDSACSCGCSRSFNGIDSATACSRAIVEEMPETDYQTMRQRLRQRTLKGWGDDEEIASEAVRSFDELSRDLEHFAIGDVLRVQKHDDVVLTKV